MLTVLLGLHLEELAHGDLDHGGQDHLETAVLLLRVRLARAVPAPRFPLHDLAAQYPEHRSRRTQPLPRLHRLTLAAGVVCGGCGRAPGSRGRSGRGWPQRRRYGHPGRVVDRPGRGGAASEQLLGLLHRLTGPDGAYPQRLPVDPVDQLTQALLAQLGLHDPPPRFAAVLLLGGRIRAGSRCGTFQVRPGLRIRL